MPDALVLVSPESKAAKSEIPLSSDLVSPFRNVIGAFNARFYFLESISWSLGPDSALSGPSRPSNSVEMLTASSDFTSR